MQKLKKKKLEQLENSFNAQDRFSAHSRSAPNTRLGRKRPTKKPKGMLSAKIRAKRETEVKDK